MSTTLLKFTAGGVLVLLLLELGTRLLIPVDRFEYIPNTYDRTCGIRQIPGARGFIACPEYEISLTISGQGLRDRCFAQPAPAGTRRVLCLGDSFTNGFGVPADSTFAKLLEGALNRGAHPERWEVINAGVAATGTAHQLAWYAMDGIRFGAEIVVLTLSPNDFVDNITSGLWSFGPDSTLVAHPAPRSGRLKALRWTRYLPGYATWFARSHFLNAVKLRFARYHHARLQRDSAHGADGAEYTRRQLELTCALLRHLAAACKENGARLFVQIVPPLVGSGTVERQTDLLVAQIHADRIACIDLREPFARQQERGTVTNYPIDGHWTAAGHRLAAVQIAARLER
jgi:hypothetical protein